MDSILKNWQCFWSLTHFKTFWTCLGFRPSISWLGYYGSAKVSHKPLMSCRILHNWGLHIWDFLPPFIQESTWISGKCGCLDLGCSTFSFSFYWTGRHTSSYRFCLVQYLTIVVFEGQAQVALLLWLLLDFLPLFCLALIKLIKFWHN